MNKFFRWVTIICLFIFMGIHYKLEMGKSVDIFKKKSDENYCAIEKDVSIINKLLDILKISGNMYYKQDFSIKNYNFNFKYIPKDDIYVSTDKPRGLLAGINKINLNLDFKKELDMSEHLSDSYESISMIVPDIAYMYYASKEGFVNIYPEIPKENYAFLRNIYKFDFIKKELLMRGRKKYSNSFWSGVYKDPLIEDLLITTGAPIYEGNKLKGVITLGLKSDFFVKTKDSGLITEFYLVDAKGNLISQMNLQNKEVTEFYDRLPKELYDKRYKFQYMKTSNIERIGKYYVYFKQIDSAPWRVYYITDIWELNAELINRNMVGIFLWILSVVFLYGASWRKAVVEDSQQAIEKLQGILKKNDKEVEKDFLTDAFTRKAFTRIANLEIDRMRRYRLEACLVMMDIDHFKRFNDTYGHACGDFVLKSFVTTVIKNIRLSDIVGRWGGEEFLILLPETDYKGALLAAEKIRKMVGREYFYYHNQSLNITVTMGVTKLNERKTLEKSVEEADEALYRGKESGRNRVVGYQDIK